MTEHYTRNTETVGVYCKVCGRLTEHLVSCGRLGACMEHQRPIKAKRVKVEQLKLFEDKE